MLMRAQPHRGYIKSEKMMPRQPLSRLDLCQIVPINAILTNSVDPNEMPQHLASHQCIYSLQLYTHSW